LTKSGGKVTRERLGYNQVIGDLRIMKRLSAPHGKICLMFISLTLLLSSCDQFSLRTPFATTNDPTIQKNDNWLQIYFTNPTATTASNYEGGPDQPLSQAIESARLSVDVAAYSLNLWSIRDALIHAHQRGVVVRAVMESDNMDESEVQDLMDTGIPVIGDQHEGLMHDKFIVIDQDEVWTGSMNFTVGGTYRDNNNLIRIRSAEAAKDYSNEFEEMFTRKRFGPEGKADTPFPDLTIDGTQVEILFSPDDSVAKRLLELINEAQESINFMAYTITSDEIGVAMRDKAQAGIPVIGVMDSGQVSSDGTEYNFFIEAGMDIRLDGNERGLLHHKVLIIDQEIVITGSYNFTASAENNNDENVVVLHDRSAAQKYLEEFQRIYNQAGQP
jgi:phosphatidylserine/phosphatidylglycerophosphate/cardiolipin synthase-like enzyme